MTTQLKNMRHAALTRNGVALQRAAFVSAGSRQRLAHLPDLAPIDQHILGTALRQLDSLEGENAKLDA